MILGLPRGDVAAQEGEEFAAAQFGPGGFNKEGAAAARTDEGVDLVDQLVGKHDLYFFRSH